MAESTIQIFVNGESRHVPERQTVASLLSVLEIPAERVAIELNKNIVRKREWETTQVGAGSQVEIVEFVGGG